MQLWICAKPRHFIVLLSFGVLILALHQRHRRPRILRSSLCWCTMPDTALAGCGQPGSAGNATRIDSSNTICTSSCPQLILVKLKGNEVEYFILHISMSSQLLWEHPNVQSTRIDAFRRHVNRKYSLRIQSYAKLHAWSAEKHIDYAQEI